MPILDTLAPERFRIQAQPGLAGSVLYTFEAGQLVPMMQWLMQHETFQIDTLDCISAVDEGTESGLVALHYQVKGLLTGVVLHLKTTVSREDGSISSIAHLFPTANWHEREAWDMVGVRFDGHPDLRRILMPADWPGHPLRQGDTPPEQYRGVYVDFEKARERNK